MGFQVYFPQPYQIGRSLFNDLSVISQSVVQRTGRAINLRISDQFGRAEPIDDFWINEDGFERVEPIDGYWDRPGAEPVDDPGISEEVIQRAEEVFRNGTFKTCSPEERRAVHLAADRLYGQMDPDEYKQRASQWFLFVRGR